MRREDTAYAIIKYVAALATTKVNRTKGRSELPRVVNATPDESPTVERENRKDNQMPKIMNVKKMTVKSFEVDEWDFAGLIMAVQILKDYLEKNDGVIGGEDRRSLYGILEKLQAVEVTVEL